MGNYRVRVKSYKNTYKRGSTSSMNPKIKKYRDIAKTTGVDASMSNSKLISDFSSQISLAPHDFNFHKNDLDRDNVTEKDDITSMAASIYSLCSNVTFSKVFTLGLKSSLFNRQVLATLSGITDVIRSEGGSQTDTEYLASLLTALSSLRSTETDSAFSLVEPASIVYLLSLVMKKVRKDVLKAKFSVISCILVKDYLQPCINSPATPSFYIKPIISCLSTLLTAQPHHLLVKSISCFEIFRSVLALSLDTRPHFRRVAISFCAKVLCVFCDATEREPAASSSPHFLYSQESCSFFTKALKDALSSQSTGTVFYCCEALSSTLRFMPGVHIKLCFESLLHLLSVGKANIKVGVLKTISSVFASSPVYLTADVNARLLSALYGSLPSLKRTPCLSFPDVKTLPYWLLAIQTALSSLRALDREIFSKHFLVGVKHILTTIPYVCHDKDVLRSLSSCVCHLISTPFSEFLSMETSSPKQTHFAANFVSLFTKFCFGAEYSSAWHLLFASVLPVLFENCENLDSTLNADLKTCLNNVIRLHDSSISCATLTQAIDRCVLSAIKFIGPDIVLPIQDISQSTWLLPLLAQTRSQHATLAQFIAHFQPQQLWNLLPAFSASPIDLSLNFSQLASPLCAILTSNAHFRSPILTSIKLILAHVLSNHADYKKNMEALSSHTKPFLSILLALYSDFHSAKDELRFVVIVCIKDFFALSPYKLKNVFIEKLLAKMQRSSRSEERLVLLDIAIAMVPGFRYSNAEENFDAVLQNFYRLVQQGFSTSAPKVDSAISKKLLRMLEEMLKLEAMKSPENILNFLNSLHQVPGCCLAPKIRSICLCLQQIKEPVEEESDSTRRHLEVTLSALSTSPSKNIRKSSAAFVDALVHKNSPSSVLRTLFAITDSREWIADQSSLSSLFYILTHLMKNNSDNLDEELALKTLDLSSFLISTSPPKVAAAKSVKMSIDFLIAVLPLFTVSLLLPKLETIMESLASLDEKVHHTHRFLIKALLLKFSRKFSFDEMSRLAPSKFDKLMSSIRKTEKKRLQERKLKAKQSKEESSRAKSKSSEKKNFPVFSLNMEDGEETSEIIDLMDETLAAKNMSIRETRVKKEKALEYSLSSDGKLIISDLFQQKDPPKKTKEQSESDHEMDTEKSLIGDTGKGLSKGQRRKDYGKEGEFSFGRRYRSKSGRSDVKPKKCVLEPYEYIPLERVRGQRSSKHPRKKVKILSKKKYKSRG